MKTLQDLAKQYRKSAAEAIYPGIDSPLAKFTGQRTIKSFKQSTAFATGNLLTKFITSPYNALENIPRKTDKGYELVLEVGPKGAEYGRYVHYGTVKMGKRPFAEIGAEEPKFVSTLNEFMEGVSDEVVDKEMQTFEDYFKKAGFTIS